MNYLMKLFYICQAQPRLSQANLRNVLYCSPDIKIKVSLKKHRLSGLSWSYSGMSINSLNHILFGNKKIGYRVAIWNCRRGLLESDGSQSGKLDDIKQYIEKHQLHIMGIIEADLHGTLSRIKRKNPLTTEEIHKKLHIEGYNIILPQSWFVHGQARVILYVLDNVHVSEKKLSNMSSDLSSISIELGLKKEKKSCFNIFYREFTGGVSGLSDFAAQKDRLCRQIEHWRTLFLGGKDVVILGDSNLCSHQWDLETYANRDLALMVQDFLLEQASHQIVKESTRMEIVRGALNTSCLDHCYTDVREKIYGPNVEAVGNSDHMAVRILKYCRIPVIKPQAVKLRSYKYFSIERFLTDIYNSGINVDVCSQTDLEKAAEIFEFEFKSILDYHAPIRTIQLRKITVLI